MMTKGDCKRAIAQIFNFALLILSVAASHVNYQELVVIKTSLSDNMRKITKMIVRIFVFIKSAPCEKWIFKIV